MKKILISARHEENKPNSFGVSLDAGYHNFGPIAELGYLPILVPAQRLTKQQAFEYISLCDSLIIMGGHDIDPVYYQEKQLFDTLNKNTYRDENDILLINAAIEQKKTIIGICRGLQIINVALGGSLYQDIELQCNLTEVHSQSKESIRSLSHTVTLEEQGFLYDLFKCQTLMVNSFHHQAVKLLGKGLYSVAHSKDGIIEAIQHETLPIYAVQWHPERSYFFEEDSKVLMKYFCEC